MRFKLTEEQIDKAVNWWADRVCAPTFNGLSDQERRDPRNDAYKMGEILVTTLVEPVAEDQRARFISALKEELLSDKYDPYWGLHVDYGPDQTLYNAAVKAGIPENNFPWKTNMYFEENGIVKARTGYGSPVEEL